MAPPSAGLWIGFIEPSVIIVFLELCEFFRVGIGRVWPLDDTGYMAGVGEAMMLAHSLLNLVAFLSATLLPGMGIMSSVPLR